MVEIQQIKKILSRLEKYLIKKADYNLMGQHYDLILFIPTDKFISDSKYSILISAPLLDNKSQREVIKELLFDFKEVLNYDEYNYLSRLNVIHSNDPLVRNMKFVFAPNREQILEINNMTVGGIEFEHAFFVKSLILDKLIKDSLIDVELSDGRTMKMRIKGIDHNFNILYHRNNSSEQIRNTIDIQHTFSEPNEELTYSIPIEDIKRVY